MGCTKIYTCVTLMFFIDLYDSIKIIETLIKSQSHSTIPDATFLPDPDQISSPFLSQSHSLHLHDG